MATPSRSPRGMSYDSNAPHAHSLHQKTTNLPHRGHARRRRRLARPSPSQHVRPSLRSPSDTVERSRHHPYPAASRRSRLDRQPNRTPACPHRHPPLRQLDRRRNPPHEKWRLDHLPEHLPQTRPQNPGPLHRPRLRRTMVLLHLPLLRPKGHPLQRRHPARLPPPIRRRLLPQALRRPLQRLPPIHLDPRITLRRRLFPNRPQTLKHTLSTPGQSLGSATTNAPPRIRVPFPATTPSARSSLE